MIRLKNRKLDEIDKELIRLKLEQPGIRYSELAERVQLSMRQVWKRVNSDQFQKALHEYQKEAIDIIRDAKKRAARRLLKLVDNKDAEVARKVCVDLCADILPVRTVGVKHSGKVTVERINFSLLTVEQLERLRDGEPPETVVSGFQLN